MGVKCICMTGRQRKGQIRYCRMPNFSQSFILPFFPECFQTGINNTGKTIQYTINTEKSLFLPINIYSLVYLNLKSTYTEKERDICMSSLRKY